MSNRATTLLLTILGTLLVIGAMAGLLVIPVYASFTVLRAGDGAGVRAVAGSLGFLLLALACAAGAWALRRLLRRYEQAGASPNPATSPPGRRGFEVSAGGGHGP